MMLTMGHEPLVRRRIPARPSDHRSGIAVMTVGLISLPIAIWRSVEGPTRWFGLTIGLLAIASGWRASWVWRDVQPVRYSQLIIDGEIHDIDFVLIPGESFDIIQTRTGISIAVSSGLRGILYLIPGLRWLIFTVAPGRLLVEVVCPRGDHRTVHLVPAALVSGDD